MPDRYVIRAATLADMPHLVRLFLGFMEHLGDPSPPRSELAAAIAPVFDDRTAEILLGGREGADPVAYAHLRRYYSAWMAGPECFVEDLFVEEAERSHGLGRMMLSAVFERARAEGCRRVRLDTNERNDTGRHLYEALGFSNERDSYDGGRQLYYTKDL